MVMVKHTKHLSEERACGMRGNSFTGIISIVGTPTPVEPNRRSAKLDSKWGDILRLWFDDIDSPYQNYVMFTDEQADRVIEWMQQHEDEFKGIFVHCAQGVSRSAAIARFIAKVYGLPFDEREGMMFNRHVFNTLCRRWKDHGHDEITEVLYLASTGAELPIIST